MASFISEVEDPPWPQMTRALLNRKLPGHRDPVSQTVREDVKYPLGEEEGEEEAEEGEEYGEEGEAEVEEEDAEVQNQDYLYNATPPPPRSRSPSPESDGDWGLIGS
jgi:hypothetical protein